MKHVMNKDKTFGQRIKKDFKMYGSLYLMMIPILIYFILFHYLPMYGVTIAFQDYRPALGFSGSDWVGFKHFERFFTSPNFWQLIRNTFRISLTSLVFGFPAPIILALLLNELKSAKLGKVIQNFTYIPHFISMVVACSIVRLFTADTGMIGSLYNSITGSSGNMLNDAENFIPIYVISGIWKEVGWGSIIYLAALTGIDQSLYEAAEVDGAGKFRKLIHITLPGIIPTIVIMLIMRMGSLLSVGYEKVLLLENALTRDVSEIISVYNYRLGLVNQQYSFSAAVGLFNTIINLIFVQSANLISRKVNGYGLW